MNVAFLEILDLRENFHNVVPKDDIFTMSFIALDFHDF